ncbi:hypothetical protein [Rothia nasisuis]|uniref:hypothetical protein n=1 Tax=Rothia nasisuis TaxID=2109647 RepID=UPI001F22DA29|nr:hypothetical protein [Rothia nasisuis]
MPSFPSGTWSTSLLERAIAAYSPRPTDQPVTSAGFSRLARHILEDGLRLLLSTGCDEITGSQVTHVKVTGVQILSAGMRSVVLRLELHGFAEPSVVLKYFRRKDSATNSGGFGYLREKHGLVALEQLVQGLYPNLLAADDTARLLILEDAAGGSSSVSLGKFLLSSGADAAPHRALNSWVDAWASILGSPAQASAQASFAAKLASADARASAPGSLPSPQLAVMGLRVLAERQGVMVGSVEFAHMEQAVNSIIYPGPSERVLSSGDFSPANLLLSGTGRLAYSRQTLRAGPVAAAHSTPTVRVVDAEGTCLHHWALPVAELLLGFPSWPAGPVPGPLLESELWQLEAQRFYELVAPAPLADVHQDERVAAAVLVVRAILAEQLQ